jgi:hypothetical protein
VTSWNSDTSRIIPLWVNAAGSLSVSESNPQKLEERVDEPEDRIPGGGVQSRHVAVNPVVNTIVMNFNGEYALGRLGFGDLKCSSSR